MKLTMYLFLMQLSVVGSCQTTKTTTTTLRARIDKEIATLKNEGVRSILTLEHGCSSCDIKSEIKCDCNPDGILSGTIFFIKGRQTYIREIMCCNTTSEQKIAEEFFAKVDTLANRVQEEKKKEDIKFFPPIATDQAYYRVKYRSNIPDLDFIVFDGQLKAGLTENNAWIIIPVFVRKKQLLEYILSFVTNDKQI